MRRHNAAIGGLVSAILLTTQPVLHPQTPPLLAAGTLTHLAVATPDVEATARRYADLFGIAVPAIRTQNIDLPNGSRAEIRSANIPLPNFSIEIDQPITKAGPVYEHLTKYGLTVHRLGISIDGNIDDIRAELMKKGGKWTAGKAGGAFAYVDLRDRIGATLEIVKSPATPPAAAATPSGETGLLGGRPLSHIGLAVRSVEETMGAFVDILGVRPAAVNEFPNPPAPFQFPPGHKWDPNAKVRTNMVRYGRISIELIQSVGSPTPWTETLEKQKGLGIQHLAVGRGSLAREEWLRLGQEKGGKWTNGGPPPQGSFAYMDFADTTGLIFE